MDNPYVSPENAGGEVPPVGGPSDVEQNPDARNWGMFCHLSALAGNIVPFGNVIGPLVVWLMKKDEMPYVDFCGKEALNFNITLTIFLLISAALACFVIGIPMLIAGGIYGIVMSIIAGIKASKGEYYRYPLTIRMIT